MTTTLTPEQLAEQTRILKEGTGRDSYLFARDVPGANVPALQARVNAVGTGMDACFFARDVPEADIAACQTRVLQVGNVWDLHIFAQDVPGANVSALHERACKLSFDSFPDEYREEFLARAAKARAFSEDDECDGCTLDAPGN